MRVVAALGAAVVLSTAAFGAPPPEWSDAKTVTVAMTEYEFAPSRLVLRAGTRYRLHLANQGNELHEFTAPEFFKSTDLGNPGVMNADRTDVALQPGKHKDLYLMPRKAGHYPLRCADHDWAGMTGEITVK